MYYHHLAVLRKSEEICIMKKTQTVFICQNILCSWKSGVRERFISEWSPELSVLVCCIAVFPVVTGSEVTLCGHVILDKHSESNYCSGLRGDSGPYLKCLSHPQQAPELYVV